MDAPIPTEFRYWEHLETPRARRARALLKLIFRRDPRLPDDVVRRFGEMYYHADPVAEAFVEDVYMTRGQRAGLALVDRALREGVDAIEDAPHTLRELFDEIEQRPPWYDAEAVALGARVFRRWNTHLFSFAGAITCEGYQESSVAKPLVLTGAYAGESANRRFLETAQFWLDVSEPGGLEPGGRGRETALRVRLMHVFVRKRLLTHPEWDLDAWGVPISQADAVLTLMGGSFLPATLLKLMGYRTSRREIEATLLFWRYVGHLMGVQPAWYPATVEEALGLMYTTWVKGAQTASEDAVHLTRSYLDAYAPRPDDDLPTRLIKAWEHRLQRGYMAFFLTPARYRQYGLPRAHLWRWHPLLQAPWIFARETLRRRSRTIDAWWDAWARRKTHRWVRARLGERSAEYRAVESFTR